MISYLTFPLPTPFRICLPDLLTAYLCTDPFCKVKNVIFEHGDCLRVVHLSPVSCRVPVVTVIT